MDESKRLTSGSRHAVFGSTIPRLTGVSGGGGGSKADVLLAERRHAARRGVTAEGRERRAVVVQSRHGGAVVRLPTPARDCFESDEEEEKESTTVAAQNGQVLSLAREIAGIRAEIQAMEELEGESDVDMGSLNLPPR
jgi:hypothetical protein